MIYDKEDRIYKKLEKERMKWLEAFGKTVNCRKTTDGVLKKATTSDSSDDGGDEVAAAGEDHFVQKKRAMKKRKLTRELREFTGVVSVGERKHKGWSDEGMEAFETYVGEIKKDVEDGKYLAWEKGFREVVERQGIYTKRLEDPLQRERYKPNIAVVWEGF